MSSQVLVTVKSQDASRSTGKSNNGDSSETKLSTHILISTCVPILPKCVPFQSHKSNMQGGAAQVMRMPGYNSSFCKGEREVGSMGSFPRPEELGGSLRYNLKSRNKKIPQKRHIYVQTLMLLDPGAHLCAYLLLS